MRLGVTGGIGSGKSYICRLLHENLDIPVYDCDARAKQLMQSDSAVRCALTALLGADAYDERGELVRPLVARYVFASPEHAQRVGDIVHPAVRLDFQRWTRDLDVDSQQEFQVAAMESAILYESGFDNEVDAVLFVDAPLELRIQRAMQRDGATREQVEARIACQQTRPTCHRATYIITNDGRTDEQLLEELKQIVKSRLVVRPLGYQVEGHQVKLP